MVFPSTVGNEKLICWLLNKSIFTGAANPSRLYDLDDRRDHDAGTHASKDITEESDREDNYLSAN